MQRMLAYFSIPTDVSPSRVISFHFIHLFISHSHILYNIVLSAFWQSLIKYMMMTMMMMMTRSGLLWCGVPVLQVFCGLFWTYLQNF